MGTIDKFINNRSPKKIVLVFGIMLIFSAVLSSLLSARIADIMANEQLQFYIASADSDNISRYGIHHDTPLELMPVWSKAKSESFALIFTAMGICSLIWSVFSIYEIFGIYDSLECIRNDCIKSADKLNQLIEQRGTDGECIRRVSESAERLAERMSYLNKCLESEKKYLQGFLMDFSHQIKTSLAVVQLNTDMLSENIQPEKREELISEIQENIDGMEEIVVKAIKLARLDTDTVEYNMHDTPLADTCRTALKRISPILRGNDITINCILPENINLNHDKGWICEAIENVLKNSADHSQCTEISVEIEENPAMTKISITDNGKGIPQADIPHLFEPFAKKSADITMKSAGLGMSIAQKIVRHHGGEIIVYSQKNTGTRFEFVFVKS